MNRLNALLPKIISSWQTGFVPGHGITDNILLAQELALDLNRCLEHPNVMMKLDMEKTYDWLNGLSYFLYLGVFVSLNGSLICYFVHSAITGFLF